MGLTPGARLGSYEVVAAIGRGGMGEVFRARDLELQRDVALKVLPDVFAADPQRLARFRREAQILASLNHPNVASIYGIHEAEGIRALVLELADGQTLAERLRLGPIPVADALALALQIAQALEAAHDKGIVHRDLKPANITLSDEGRIKVLDFGLAKALDTAQASQPDELTLTEHDHTKLGAVMGTAGYMSPEQARGRQVDRRTDIWAFGCVLFEMLVGDAPFRSETSSDTVAAVLGRDPDWGRLPDRLPSRIHALLRRCLEKDHRERLRDIGDARLELRDALAAGVAADDPRLALQSGGGLWRTAAIVLGIAALALTAIAYALSGRQPAAPEWRNPLADAVFARLTDFDGAESSAAISPDGRFVAFRADRDGPQDIWLTQVGTGTFVNLTRGKEEELLLPVRNADAGVELLRERLRRRAAARWDDDELAERIGEFDAILIRSATKMTAELIERADRLKVIGAPAPGSTTSTSRRRPSAGSSSPTRPSRTRSPPPSTRWRWRWRCAATCRRPTARWSPASGRARATAATSSTARRSA